MVAWVIGLSAAGKTTIAKELFKIIKKKNENTILLDGDVLRKVFGGDTDHTVSGRAINAKRLSQLSKFLSDQNINVIAAVLSIFPEWQTWNRMNIKDYCQIYLKVPMDVLIKREYKGLYKGAIDGTIKNVVGYDIDFPEPVGNDLIIDNSKEKLFFNDYLEKIIKVPAINNLLS